MQRFIDDLTENVFGTPLSEAQDARKCVVCGAGPLTAEDFRDQLSRKEWGISGMCQECQDKTFGEPPEESFPEDWGIPTKHEHEYPGS